MAMTEKGISTTIEKGQEQYETFRSHLNKKPYVMYDYRDHDGQLFSCVRPTLDKCRTERDFWLSRKKQVAS